MWTTSTNGITVNQKLKFRGTMFKLKDLPATGGVGCLNDGCPPQAPSADIFNKVLSDGPEREALKAILTQLIDDQILSIIRKDIDNRVRRLLELCEEAMDDRSNETLSVNNGGELGVLVKELRMVFGKSKE